MRHPNRLSFDVYGDPAPQGSKSRMPNGAVLEGKTAAQRAKHKAWRTAVAEAARDITMTPEVAGGSIADPVILSIEFRFPPAKSRLRRVEREVWIPKTTAPDLDKLIRSTGDGLVDGGLLRDDALIYSLGQCSKVEILGWHGARISLVW